MQTAEKPARRRSKGCRLGLLLLLAALCLVATAALAAGIRWRQVSEASGILLRDAAPNLNPIERLMLQSYLAGRAEQLEEPAGRGTEAVRLLIAPGETADTVANNLVSGGALNDSELFLNYLRYYGLDSRLQAGTFTLNPQWSISELAAVISDGSARDVTLRFLPGLRLEEMAEYLALVAPHGLDAEEFLAIAGRRQPFDTGNYTFLASLPPEATLEGYLLPGTYNVPPTADAPFLVDLMLQNFEREVTPAMRQAFGAQGLSLREALILASIVAREAVVEEERPVIASVFLNRLRAGMPLQADPTVQYALGYQPDSGSWWKVPLALEDLEVNHPYNTYVIPGLPPGPIANPGLASLQAVAEPAQTDYLFFVLDCVAGDGRHLFSTTFEEHLVNVQRCQ